MPYMADTKALLSNLLWAEARNCHNAGFITTIHNMEIRDDKVLCVIHLTLNTNFECCSQVLCHDTVYSLKKECLLAKIDI